VRTTETAPNDTGRLQPAAKKFQKAEEICTKKSQYGRQATRTSQSLKWHGDCIRERNGYHPVMQTFSPPMHAHTPRTPHTPVKEPLEPEEPGGPIDPDDGEPDDPVETPERSRLPGKHA